MKRIEVPGTGGAVLVPDEDAVRIRGIIESRDAFVSAYCVEREWDRDTLTITQILEIRAQEGWKRAVQEEGGE